MTVTRYSRRYLLLRIRSACSRPAKHLHKLQLFRSLIVLRMVLYNLQCCLQYYLKARFHFNKNQFAGLMLMSGLIMTVSQLFLTPLLVPAIGEKKLLSIGLLMSCTNSLLLSIAWSKWIPYAAIALYVLMIFVNPCRQVGFLEVRHHLQPQVGFLELAYVCRNSLDTTLRGSQKKLFD